MKPFSEILRTERVRNLLLGAVLVAGLFLAYARVWHAGFIWDDDDHLTKNPCIIGPLGFGHIWTSSAAVYYPLVLSSLWLQHALWGLNPLPYHLVDVALHAVSALLLWGVLARLQVRGAWLGAALWALHPVQVESAAWITEQKNTQSCFLYLLSITCFLSWKEESGASSAPGRRAGFYLLALLCAVCGILSKTSTVMLPVILGLIWWWRGWGSWRRSLVALAPFFLISALAGLWTVWEQKYHSGAMGGMWELDPIHRLLIAGRVPWFYLGKLLWPHPLIFIYPRWVVDPSRVLQWLPLLGLPALITPLWILREKSWASAVLFAAVYFLVSLFPVMGFFNVYFFRYSFVGDHFQYLASIGPMALAGAALTAGFGVVRVGRQPLFLLTMALLTLLGIVTWHQCGQYDDNVKLWNETLRWNPSCGIAHNNLGTILLQEGREGEASEHFGKALAHGNLGAVALHEGRVDEAIAHFEKALLTDPKDPYANCNLGWALRQKSRYAEALPYFEKALGDDPATVAGNAGFAAGVHYNMGDTMLQMGRTREAIRHFELDMALNPVVDAAEGKIAEALLAEGREKEAMSRLRHLLLAKPRDAATLQLLGKLLYRQGERAEGIACLKQGLLNLPQPSLLNDLAWMLATAPEANLRDGKQALELARKVLEVSGEQDPNTLDTLGAAYAEIGDFAKALETARKALALALAQAAGNKELSESLRKEIGLYESGKPMRDPVP